MYGNLSPRMGGKNQLPRRLKKREVGGEERDLRDGVDGV